MVAAPGAYVPARGDAIWINLHPQAGHEQAGRRPAVVLSPSAYNGRVGLALLCPITNQRKGYPFEVRIPSRLRVTGVVLADYKEHVVYTVGMVARHGVLEPPAASAAVYLATRFEFFFRVLSGKLQGDGTWLHKAVDQPVAVATIGKKGLQGDRVSDVAVTYKLMKLNQSRPAAGVFDTLDKAICSVPLKAVGGFHIADIGDRIAFGRHSAGHAFW